MERDGRAWVGAHPEVPTISFTGGTTTGRDLAVSCAKQFKEHPWNLEAKIPLSSLPMLIDRAATEAAGPLQQHRTDLSVWIKDLGGILSPAKFQEKLLAAAAMRVGDPAEETHHIGSLVSEPHYLKVKQAIEAAGRCFVEAGGLVVFPSLPRWLVP